MKRFKIFVDGDGTLVKFDKEKTLFEVSKKGYFRDLPALGNMANAMDILKDYAEIFLLSAVLPYDYVIADKDYCYDRVTPFIDKEHRIYVPYGVDKNSYLKGCSKKDIFLDDYTKNLEGVGDITAIKVLNRINNTHGTWTGAVVNAYSKADVIADTIMGLHLRKEIL